MPVWSKTIPKTNRIDICWLRDNQIESAVWNGRDKAHYREDCWDTAGARYSVDDLEQFADRGHALFRANPLPGLPGELVTPRALCELQQGDSVYLYETTDTLRHTVTSQEKTTITRATSQYLFVGARKFRRHATKGRRVRYGMVSGRSGVQQAGWEIQGLGKIDSCASVDRSQVLSALVGAWSRAALDKQPLTDLRALLTRLDEIQG